jgi:hypothetical protein
MKTVFAPVRRFVWCTIVLEHFGRVPDILISPGRKISRNLSGHHVPMVYHETPGRIQGFALARIQKPEYVTNDSRIGPFVSTSAWRHPNDDRGADKIQNMDIEAETCR